MLTQASWLTPPECVILNNDEVHVYRASLEMTPSQVKTLEQMLSADELTRTAGSASRRTGIILS